MITLNIYIPLIVGLIMYKLIEPTQELLKSRFKIYPWILLIMLFTTKEWMIVVFVLILIELEFIYFLLRSVNELPSISWFKLHFLTLTELSFMLLIGTTDKYTFIFTLLLLLPFAFFYAIFMLIASDYFKVNRYQLIGFVSLFGIIPFFSSPSLWTGIINGGVVAVLPMMTYYVLLPSFSKNRFEYFLKNLLYVLFIEMLFQVFLLFSANLAYTEAVKLEVKGIEDKTFWSFYSPYMEEIYIDEDTRWSYHRFNYVNEWD